MPISHLQHLSKLQHTRLPALSAYVKISTYLHSCAISICQNHSLPALIPASAYAVHFPSTAKTGLPDKEKNT